MSHRLHQIRWPAMIAGLTLIAGFVGVKFFGARSAAPEAAMLAAAPPEQAIVGPSGLPGLAPAAPSELRRRFPIVSVSQRLDYEAPRRAQADRLAPTLTDDSRKHLDELEAHYGQTLHGTIRSESLSLLHSKQVEEFVRSEGFGMSRMPVMKPSPEHLPYPEPVALPLAAASADDLDGHPVATVTLPERGVIEEGGGAWTPSREMLTSFHFADEQAFASPWSLGWIKNRNHVAGFVSHGFAYAPELVHPQNQYLPPDPAHGNTPRDTHPDRWKIGRLELVSLLKHEEPAVYISENLPRMKDLEKAKTRPITEFEERALESLRAGEDVVAAPSTNDIFMVGAVRAVKQCTECHAVQRGELLGAFSYRLKRSPPVEARVRPIKPPA